MCAHVCVFMHACVHECMCLSVYVYVLVCMRVSESLCVAVNGTRDLLHAGQRLYH